MRNLTSRVITVKKKAKHKQTTIRFSYDMLLCNLPVKRKKIVQDTLYKLRRSRAWIPGNGLWLESEAGWADRSLALDRTAQIYRDNRNNNGDPPDCGYIHLSIINNTFIYFKNSVLTYSCYTSSSFVRKHVSFEHYQLYFKRYHR